MNVLFLAEQSAKAQFIHNGLRYENLFAELYYFKDLDAELKQKVLQANGLFILMQNISALEKAVDYVLDIKSDLPIILLSYEFQPFYFQLLHESQKIRNFFTRPFPFRLMANEIRTQIFHDREKIHKSVLKIRDLQLNRETHEIVIDGRTLYLRNKEFALLEFLMMNVGRVLSRETILEHVWDHNANIFTNTVDVHINKLRKKISKRDTFIRTIPCSGYLIA